MRDAKISMEEMPYWQYHRLWGLQRYAHLPTNNFAIEIARMDARALQYIEQQQLQVSRFNIIWRCLYRLFNIDDYAHNTHKLSFYNAYIQQGNPMPYPDIEVMPIPSELMITNPEPAKQAEPVCSESDFKVHASMQAALQVLGLELETGAMLSWKAVKSAYKKQALLTADLSHGCRAW